MSESERTNLIRKVRNQQFPYKTKYTKDGIPGQVLKSPAEQGGDRIRLSFAERGERVLFDGRGGWSMDHSTEITVWDYLR